MSIEVFRTDCLPSGRAELHRVIESTALPFAFNRGDWQSYLNWTKLHVRVLSIARFNLLLFNNLAHLLNNFSSLSRSAIYSSATASYFLVLLDSSRAIKEYYSQRASQYGMLLISEATLVAASGAQQTSKVYLRRTRPTRYQEAPRPLSIPEIEEYVALHAQAAINATQQAGFDGVEIHFSKINQTGGPTTVVKAVGATKTGIRLCPWNGFLGQNFSFPVLDLIFLSEMRMDAPKATYTHLVTQIKERFPNLADIHVVEPRISGVFTRETFRRVSIKQARGSDRD
ncbi:hypothetical protein BDZ89DRAFT_1140388 [Hymenopellis radicata]|nr:hypothetical protein BDZ89DRAFT_1140388 [Hymenopellis radicata]